MRERACATAVLIAALLGGCGGASPDPSAQKNASDAQQEASVRVGDTVMRTSVVPTETLGEAVAAQYGIAREPGSLLLLIGVRRGSDAQETALPARITAGAVDLLGKRQAIELREVRSGDPGSKSGAGFIDYAGTARVIAPDTLRFDIEASVDGAPRLTLQFNRDFFPR